MKKKMFGKVLAFATLLSTTMALAAGAAGKVTFDISKAEAQPGEEVELTLTVTQNDGFVSALFNLSYDEGALTFVKTVDAGKYGTVDHNKTKPILYWNNGTAEENYTNKDLAATFTFTIAEDAEIGSTIPVTIDLSKAQIFDVDMDDVECVVNDGSVKVLDAPELPDSVKVTFADRTLTYTGKAQKVEATVKGAPTGTTITYSDDCGTEKVDSYAVTAAGEYHVTATISAPGYKAKEVTATVTVAQKELTVSNLTAANKTYDGNTDAALSGGKLVGVVSGDEVEADFPTHGTFASKNVGTGIAVTFEDITLSGADSENYTVKAPSVKANIAAAELKVKADDKSMAKGAELPALTYTIDSEIFDELDDVLSGSLTTKADGTKVDTFDILQGSLKASSNYKLIFTKGTLTVEEKKAQEGITVAELTEKTVGDEPFKLEVTAEAIEGLDAEITFSSSDPEVASIDAEGMITIHKAGTTVITVSRAGNDTYAVYENKQTLKVNKLAQTIALSGAPETVTYGDADFTLTATADENSGLDTFTFETSDDKIATVDENGKVTVLAAGEVTITVKQAGNDSYAEATASVTVNVEKKTLKLDESSVDLDVPSVGFAADAAPVSDDEVTVSFESSVEANDDGSYTVTLTGFALTGADADNYTLDASDIIYTVASEDAKDMLVEVNVTAANGSVAGVGMYVKGTKVTLTAVPDSKYRFNNWKYKDGKKVTDAEIVVVAGEEVPTPTFSKKSAGSVSYGSSDGKYDAAGNLVQFTVRFESNFGSFVNDRHVNKNNTLNRPDDPVRVGYVFDGWYTDALLTNAYDFETRVTENFTLYAKWIVEGADTWTNPFTDVGEEDWFFEAVKYANKKSLMNGMSASTFDPNTTLTRAMFVTILYRVEGEPAVSGTTNFTDVVSGSWYEKAVIWAVNNGIVTGITETEFAPEASITREQMATILYRYAAYKGYDVAVRGETSYTDKDEVSEYAGDAVIWAFSKAIMSGHDNGSFAPKDEATRAQAAAVFMRFIENENI